MINKVVFSSEAIKVFSEEIKKHGLIETGGALLGYQEDKTLFITKATHPGSRAIHEELYFEADHEYVEMIIDLEYADSKGKIKHQGEWHTHPEIKPTPSLKDCESITKIAANSKSFSILTIIGAIDFVPNKLHFNCTTLIGLKYQNRIYLEEIDVTY